MALPEKPTLTILERIQIPYFNLKNILTGIVQLLLFPLWPFRDSKLVTKRFRDHVRLAMLRNFPENASGKQLVAISPTNHEAYLAFAEHRGFEPKWETLPSGRRAHWIGDPNAEKVMIFYHGGGYNLPLAPNFFPFLHQLVVSTPGIAMLLPTYTLAWQDTWPAQLRDGVEALDYVLHTLKRKPSTVSLAGDSAGGNLTCAVISHILHPHPDIKPLDVNEPLLGAVLISTWAGFDTKTGGSWETNGESDLINAALSDKWRANYVGGVVSDGWNDPTSQGSEWWTGLEAVVKDVLITAGTKEILFDPNQVLAQQMKVTIIEIASSCRHGDLTNLQVNHSRVDVVFAEGEWHENMLHDDPPDQVGISRDAVFAFARSKL